MSSCSKSLSLSSDSEGQFKEPIPIKKVSIENKQTSSQQNQQNNQFQQNNQDQSMKQNQTIKNEIEYEYEQGQKIDSIDNKDYQNQKYKYFNNQNDQEYESGQKNGIMAPRDYYNLQEKYTETSRAFSKLVCLRNFQNWVKATLINEYTNKLKQSFTDKRNLLNVCELGCGKGGDMTKWSKAGTGLWFGLDISNEALKEAQRRHHNSKEEKKKQIQKIYLMEASANLDSTLFRSRLPQDIYFDFVSMQFMANLLFSSEMDVNNMFENITCRLTNQGLVLMTITDANVLVKKMRQYGEKDENGQYIYNKNQYFSLKFDKLNFDKQKPWGLQYLFYLEDAVGMKINNQINYVPEYLIELQAFEQKAKEYNLEIIENLNFIDFYEKYKYQYADLLKIMIKPPTDNWKMPADQWEIVHLYRVVVLRHMKGQPQSKIRRHPNLTDLPDDVLELESNL